VLRLSFHEKPQDFPPWFVLYTTLALFKSERPLPQLAKVRDGAKEKRVGDAHASKN
jgi:hypothetical protein